MRRTILVLLMVLFALSHAPIFVFADEEEDEDVFDITGMPFEGDAPSWVTGYTLPKSEGATLISNYYRWQQTSGTYTTVLQRDIIEYELDGETSISYLQMEIAMWNNITCLEQSQRNWGIYFYDDDDNVMYPGSLGSQYTYWLRQYAQFNSSWATINIDLSAINAVGQDFALSTLTPKKIRIQATVVCQTNGTRTQTIQFRALRLYRVQEAIANYVIPILEDNRQSISASGDNTVAVAIRAFLPVHAPANAVVTAISILSPTLCDDLGIDCSDYTFGAYRVSLLVGDTLFYYVVSSPHTYLDVGLTIAAGCIMGESTQPSSRVFSTIPLAQFTIEPSIDAQSCKTPQSAPRTCFNDGIQDITAWNKSGDVNFDGSEIRLGIGGKIYQVIALPRQRRARLTIVARGGRLDMRIGETIQVYNLSDNVDTTVEITYDYHNPNLGDFWELSIKNTGTSESIISDICLQVETEEEALVNGVPPPIATNCYFENYSFSAGLEAWSSSNGTRADVGQILVPDGGGFAQNAVLLPGEYTLTIVLGLWHEDDFVRDSNDTSVVVISYVYPLTEEPIYYDFPDITIGQIAEFGIYSVSVTITIEEESTGDFYFELAIPTIDKLNGLRVTRICLQPPDGDWGEAGYFPPIDTPFDDNCEVISPPQGADWREWTAWHWHNFSQFFDCDLMVTLNNTYGLLKWFQAVTILFFNWLDDLSGWISGHVDNLVFAIANAQAMKEYELPANVPSGDFFISGMSGISTTQNLSQTLSGGDECRWYDVFCHGRNIVGGVIDFGWGIVTDIASVIINFIGALLATIVDWITYGFRQFHDPLVTLWDNIQYLVSSVADMVSFITDAANALITIWNDTDPIAPPGLQDCQVEPDTKMNCLFFWGLEHTIFSGEYGQLIIPLLTSILGITGLLMLIGKFLEIVRTAKDA